MHAFSHVICICIRVATATEEVIYEVVVEPQGQAPQQEDRGEPAQGPIHPSTKQQTQGKPRCTSYYLKLWHLYIYILLVHYV